MSPTSIDRLASVSKTLLIPLVGRAIAQRRFPATAFADAEAAGVLARLERECPAPRLERLKQDRLIVRGTIRRTQSFDQIARDFIARHPEATIVNLGAGLCTRFSRVDNGRIRWLDVDVPEVVELRRELMPPRARQTLASTATQWLEGFDPQAGPALVLAEGVLMFMEPIEVATLVRRFANHLPAGSEWAFDYIHPLMVRLDVLRPRSMKALSARYRWGTTRIPDLLRDHPRFEVISDRAFSRTWSRPARLAERPFRRLLTGPILDIAHLRLR